jgi:hypothetical protein
MIDEGNNHLANYPGDLFYVGLGIEGMIRIDRKTIKRRRDPS